MQNLNGTLAQIKQGENEHRAQSDKSLDDLEQYLRGLLATGIDGLGGSERDRGILGHIMLKAERAAHEKYMEAKYAAALQARNAEIAAQEKQIRILQAILSETKA